MPLTKVSSLMVSSALADFSGNLPAQRVTGKKVARVDVTTDTDIPYALTEISGFRKNMLIPTTGVVLLTWSVDMSHRGVSAGSPTYDPPQNPNGDGHMPLGTYYPIGISGQIAWRRAAVEADLSAQSFSYISTSIAAGQLSDRKQHYQTIGMARLPFAVDGGYYYQFSLALSSHTDAGIMSGVDGAAELTTGGGKNFVLIEYEPGMTIEA